MRWQERQAGPRVTGHSAAVVDDAMLVFGGMTLTTHGPATPDDLNAFHIGVQC